MIEAELQRLLAGTDESARSAADLTNLGVLVIHESPYHELLFLAAEKIGGVHWNVHYAATLEEGLEIASQKGLRIDSVFVEFGRIVDITSVIRRFGRGAHLQQIVVICANDDEVGEFESLEYTASIATLRETATPSQFIVGCRVLLENLRLRAQLLQNFSEQRALLASTSSLEDLGKAMTPLVTGLASFFAVDALLVADLKSRSSEIVAINGDRSGIRALLRRVARREQAKLDASQEAEMRLLASLMGSEIANKLDSEKSTLRSTEFASLKVDDHEVLIAYAYAMHDSLVSSFVVAPNRHVVFETVMCMELEATLDAWARHHEKLTMTALRQRLELESQKADISLQDSLTELVCGVSHEINTPLSIIRTAALIISDLAQEASTGNVGREELVEDITGASSMIETNVVRLGELVERFKAVAVSQAPETPSRTLIMKPIDDAIERMSTKNLTVNKLVDVDPNAEVWYGYPRRFEEVIYLLLENAWQHAYNSAGGLAEVRIRGREVDGQLRYSVAVADFGTGIERENLPRIFELFYTTSRHEQAPGLGLAIAKSLVTGAFGGELRCESELGRGTVFTMDFSALDDAAAGSIQ